MDVAKQQFFTETLLKWDDEQNHRPLPWKGISNPYFIWLSEIILQQTRVEQGLPYYIKFTETYPTVFTLANAPEDEIMKLWEGLGYYSRARNLHAAAKQIAFELNGKFPKSYKQILSLKGVGPYTAAAIASFAYNLPHAVLDGNVYRVLSRFFGVETPIDSTEGKKFFTDLANQLISQNNAAKYNQAIMDFGAKHCSPKKPLCLFCPMEMLCSAHQNNKVELLPIKAKKIKRRTRYFYFVMAFYKGQFYIEKRTKKGIWQNLYQLPLIETKQFVETEILKQKIKTQFTNSFKLLKISQLYTQILTHQTIKAHFAIIHIKNQNKQNKNWIKIAIENRAEYAYPKVINEFFANFNFEEINVNTK